MEFSDRLLSDIDRKKSYAVVGLDPEYLRIPQIFRGTSHTIENDHLTLAAESIFRFNCCVLDVVAPFIAAVKPQMAFYEAYGVAGISVFVKTVAYARNKGLLVIEDAKRGDIGNTARAYSNGHIGRVSVNQGLYVPVFDVDAITVNPYLGSDGLKPFLDDVGKHKKGIFVLVKTSNPSSVELQDLVVKGSNRRVFEHVGEWVRNAGDQFIGKRRYSDVGAVVGATFPEQARVLRTLMPKTIMLVPGYGAQGATGKDMPAFFNKDGYGAIISASRSIIFPHGNNLDVGEEEYRGLVFKAIQSMNSDINESLKNSGVLPW